MDASGQGPNIADANETSRFSAGANAAASEAADTGNPHEAPDDVSTAVGMKNGVRERQLMLRQLGVLDSAMDILHAATLPDGNIEPMFLNLTRATYALTQSIITGLPTHQVSAAANMSLYLQHIRQHVGAEEAITALLENNVPLLEGPLGHLAVRQFLDHTKSFGISSSVLVFLAEACTTDTDILEFNQRRICEAILSPQSSLFDLPPAPTANPMASSLVTRGFLRLAFCTDKPAACRPWYSRRISTLLQRVEFPCTSDAEVIMAAHLVQNGMMPVVVVDPNGNSTDLSSITYGRNPKLAKLLDSQLRLFAALCRGRNYTAIQSLEPFFPFDLCVTCIKSEHGSDRIRGAMALLVSSLWVDRWPSSGIAVQKPVHNIEHDFFSSQAKTGGVTPRRHDLTFLASEVPHRFELLKDALHWHLSVRGGTMVYAHSEVNQSIADMVKLLVVLVRCGYYTDVEELRDLVVMLMSCIDEGRDHLHTNDLAFSSALEMQKGAEFEHLVTLSNGVTKWKRGFFCLSGDRLSLLWWREKNDEKGVGRDGQRCTPKRIDLDKVSNIVVPAINSREYEESSIVQIEWKAGGTRKEFLLRGKGVQTAREWRGLLNRVAFSPKNPQTGRRASLTSIVPVSPVPDGNNEGHVVAADRGRETLSEDRSRAYSMAKCEMCVALLDITKVWKNYRCALLVRGIKEAQLGTARRMSRNSCLQIVDDVLEATAELDLTKGGTVLIDRTLSDVLFDLCCSEHSSLVAAAFELLLTLHLQRHDLVKAASTIQLIDNPLVAKRYSQAVENMRTIQLAVETFEIWGTEDADDGNATENTEYRNILDSLDSLVSNFSEADKDGNSVALATAIHLSALSETLIGLIRVPLDFQCETLTESTTGALRCLQWLAKQDKLIRHDLLHHVDTLLTCSHSTLCSVQQNTLALLASIVYDNDADMLRSVDDRIIAHSSTALSASDDAKVKTAHIKVLIGLLKSGPVIPDDVQLSIFHASKRAAFAGYFEYASALIQGDGVEEKMGDRIEPRDRVSHAFAYCVNLARFANLCVCSRNAVSLGIQAVAIQVFPLEPLLQIIGACQRRTQSIPEMSHAQDRKMRNGNMLLLAELLETLLLLYFDRHVKYHRVADIAIISACDVVNWAESLILAAERASEGADDFSFPTASPTSSPVSSPASLIKRNARLPTTAAAAVAAAGGDGRRLVELPWEEPNQDTAALLRDAILMVCLPIINTYLMSKHNAVPEKLKRHLKTATATLTRLGRKPSWFQPANIRGTTTRIEPNKEEIAMVIATTMAIDASLSTGHDSDDNADAVIRRKMTTKGALRRNRKHISGEQKRMSFGNSQSGGRHSANRFNSSSSVSHTQKAIESYRK